MNESNSKPQVLPTKDQRNEISEAQKIASFNIEKSQAINEILTSPIDTPPNHSNAYDQMRENTARQLEEMRLNGVVRHEDNVEGSTMTSEEFRNKSNNDEILIRDKQLQKNKEQTAAYHKQYEEAANKHLIVPDPITPNKMTSNTPPIPPIPPSTPTQNSYDGNYGRNPSNIDPHIFNLSQPNYNAPFDVIPLPSGGKLYQNKKRNVRISYMTTSDENILTSPNLLNSGEFLEILINRKLLEPDLRYKDLTVGDRNAIMIWLRATAYGEMYPVTIMDQNNEPFDTDINLNNLKTIELGAEPDSEGLFSFVFKLSQVNIKFRMLTCGDIDYIDKLVTADTESGSPVDRENEYKFERMIIEVNGDRNRTVINDFANNIRVKDGSDFKTYIESIESGIDLNINVRTHGGESVDTFLPLNISFFWPNFRL